MPGTTPRGYPYPLPADSINVPRDMQALAEAIDADQPALAGLDTHGRPAVLEPGQIVGPVWANALRDLLPGPEVRLGVAGAASGVFMDGGETVTLDFDVRTSDVLGPEGINIVLTEPGAYLFTVTVRTDPMPAGRFVAVVIHDENGQMAAGFVPPGEESVTVSWLALHDGGVNTLWVTVRNPDPTGQHPVHGRFTAVRIAA